MFTQISAKKVIKLFKESAVAAIVKEYIQIDDMNVVDPKPPFVLTPNQTQKSLRAVSHVKEKRCGKIKGLICDDVSTQRGPITREDASLSAIPLDALISALVVDSYEGQDVAIFDVT